MFINKFCGVSFVYLLFRFWNWQGIYPMGLVSPRDKSTGRTWYYWLEDSQYIYENKWNNKNRHPCHDIPQTCGGSKSVCMVWIHPNANFLTHTTTTLSINEPWSNRYDTQKSKINKRRPEKGTWSMFKTQQSNQLKQKSLNTQTPPYPRTSTNMRGKKPKCLVWIV